MVDVADAGAGKAGGKPDLILPPGPTNPPNLEKTLGQHVGHKQVEGGTSKLKNQDVQLAELKGKLDEQGTMKGQPDTVGQHVGHKQVEGCTSKLKNQDVQLAELKGKLDEQGAMKGQLDAVGHRLVDEGTSKLNNQKEELSILKEKLKERDEVIMKLNGIIQGQEKIIDDQKKLISEMSSSAITVTVEAPTETVEEPAIAETVQEMIEREVDWYIFTMRVIAEVGLTVVDANMKRGRDKFICTIVVAAVVFGYNVLECFRSHGRKPWVQNGKLKVQNIIWETEIYGLLTSFLQLAVYIVAIWQPIVLRIYFQTCLFNLCVFLGKMYKRSHRIKKVNADV